MTPADLMLLELIEAQRRNAVEIAALAEEWERMKAEVEAYERPELACPPRPPPRRTLAEVRKKWKTDRFRKLRRAQMKKDRRERLVARLVREILAETAP